VERRRGQRDARRGGGGWHYGWRFGAIFGALSTVGQVAAYRAGIRPTLDYAPRKRPRLTWRQFLAAVNRSAGYAVATWVSAVLSGEVARPWPLALRAGLTIGADREAP
jgi:hypothetical protein